MKVVNIQEKHVQALITALLVTELCGTGLGIVINYKYTRTSFFPNGTPNPPEKSGQIFASLSIVCASICSANSATSFSLLNQKHGRFWCATNISSTTGSQNKAFVLELELDKQVKSKNSQLDHARKWRNLTKVEGNARMKIASFLRTNGIGANNRMNRTKEIEITRNVSSGTSRPALNYKKGSTLQTNKRKPNTNTKVFPGNKKVQEDLSSTREEKASAYFATYGGPKNHLQIAHLYDDTLSQNCFDNMERWLSYPAVIPELGSEQSRALKPTVLSFQGMVVICGGNVQDKATRTTYPLKTCYSWQGTSAKMQSFASLSWPRVWGEAFLNKDGSSFAIIGGRGKNPEFSNYFDIYKDGSFKLEKSKLPKMIEKPCIASNKEMEHVFIVSRARTGSAKLHQVNRNNYESITLESPSKNIAERYTCSIFSDKYMVITSIVKEGSRIMSQVFDIQMRSWTKVISDQASPCQDGGVQPNTLHYLTHNGTNQFLIFGGIQEISAVDPKTYRLFPSGGTLNSGIFVTRVRPLLISNEMAESVCNN